MIDTSVVNYQFIHFPFQSDYSIHKQVSDEIKNDTIKILRNLFYINGVNRKLFNYIPYAKKWIILNLVRIKIL